MEFKIVKLDYKRSNIVVSRRAILEDQGSEERTKLLESLAVGKVVEGVVKNLTDYGCFVDLGGIDDLLHITDMSWKRVKHPSDLVKIGDEISVKVLSFDKEKNRVSLGLKQMQEDPWEDLIATYPVGSKVFGKVTNLTEYGCFVEIGSAIEGLVHMSEMDWTNRNVSPNKVVKVGDEVEVQLSITSKHALEYVQLRDPRAAGFEPTSSRSGHNWDLGLSWYQEVRDSSTNFFFERLPHGEYTFKYRLRATTQGVFKTGPAVIQPVYAPEFVGYSSGRTMTIRAQTEP